MLVIIINTNVITFLALLLKILHGINKIIIYSLVICACPSQSFSLLREQ